MLAAVPKALRAQVLCEVGKRAGPEGLRCRRVKDELRSLNVHHLATKSLWSARENRRFWETF